jgi:hypothetical protein
MNRKRLAISAAVIGAVTGAIANPVLTGRLPYCRPAYNLEFIRQQNDIARDAYFKTHGAPDPSSPDAGALPFPIRGAEVPPDPDPFAPKPTFAQTALAALRQQNPIMSVLDAVSSMPGNQPQPGYNPLDTIKGTPHEGDDLSIYAGSYNEAYTRALMARKDREDEDRRTLAAFWAGTADCSDLVRLLVSVLLGATGAAALSYFGPRLLARLVAGLIALWLRWLRWVRE